MKPDLPYEVVVPHSGGWVWGKNPRFDWCKQNCQGDYRSTMFNRNQTVWHFQSVKDATLFALKWS